MFALPLLHKAGLMEMPDEYVPRREGGERKKKKKGKKEKEFQEQSNKINKIDNFSETHQRAEDNLPRSEMQ